MEEFRYDKCIDVVAPVLFKSVSPKKLNLIVTRSRKKYTAVFSSKRGNMIIPVHTDNARGGLPPLICQRQRGEEALARVHLDLRLRRRVSVGVGSLW